MSLPSFTMDTLASYASENPEKVAEIARQYRKAMIVMARKDPNYFCAYVLKDERTGKPIQQHPDHEFVQQALVDNSRVAVWTHPGWGKGLPLDTEIPTPDGWKRLDQIYVGSVVYGSNGAPASVTEVRPDQNIRVYEVLFDDGVKVQADESHLWNVYCSYDRSLNKTRVRTVSTADMAKRDKQKDGRGMWAVPVCGPVQYPERQLPVPAYVMGAWLGDGNTAGPYLTVHQDDRAIYDLCASLLVEPSTERADKLKPHILRCRLGGKALRQTLNDLGVTSGKFIPEIYLRSSVEQRYDLLAGLLDTDGCCYSISGKASYIELSFCNELLASGALELVRSLGFKARMRPELAKLYGREVGTRYRIFFTAHRPVFRLARKLTKQTMEEPRGGTSTTRTIVSITEIPSVATRCIAVNSPDNTFLAGRAYTVTHNCNATGTPVLREDGTWVPVQDMKEWTRVYTWAPGDPDPKIVTARSTDNGKHPCLRITLEDGRELTVTHNHPLMNSGMEWVRADQLRAGSKVIVLRKFDLDDKFYTPEEELPADEAEILGYLLAGRALRTGSVQVRTMYSSQTWSDRRDKLFRAAGWKRVPVTGVEGTCIGYQNVSGDLAPGTFLASWATLRNGCPVEVDPRVYRLPQRSLERLLSAFWSAAFMDIQNAERRSIMAETSGIARNRAPKMVGMLHKETLEMIQRLMLRTGATAELFCKTDNRYSYRTYKQVYGKYAQGRKPWQLTLGWGEFKHFWPSNIAADPIGPVYAVPIKAIELIQEPQQTWAVEVLEKEHSFIGGGILNHNTNQISIGHVLWRIGKDPNTAIAIMTNTGALASRIVNTLKTYIAESPEFRDVFPHIKPGAKWSEMSFTVERDTIRKDPTVQAVGLTGAIVGARLDGLIIDDIDDIDSTHTIEARNITENKVRKEALTRLSANGWAFAVGNIWHENDCMHRLAGTNWLPLKYPILNKEGESRDPEQFPMWRVHQLRDEDIGPLEFQRLYMLAARIDGEQRFKQEWIDTALEKSRGLYLMPEGLDRIPTGSRTITGVDLGVKQKSTNDPTAIITILETPTGPNRVEYQILNIVWGRWNAQEIMDEVMKQQKLFASSIWVESNAAQDLLIQLLNMNGSGVKVNAFWTGKNKYDPNYGVESIAAELAMGNWWIPSGEGTMDELELPVRRLVDEMLAYIPGNHTGDLLMALWIARESARTSRAEKKSPVQFGRLRLRR